LWKNSNKNIQISPSQFELEVREGLVKHYTAFDHPSKRADFARKILTRSPNRDLADEITYYSHDLDDGLESGLLSEKI